MSVVLRSNTFTIFPEPYLDEAGNPRMPFRRYQTEVWEPWLKQAYSDETQHFLAKPDIQYAKQLDPHLLACAEAVKQTALTLYATAAIRQKENLMREFLLTWCSKSREQREAVLLEIWEAEHVMYEKMQSPIAMVETPELTLELAGEQLGPLIRLLRACHPPSSFNPSTSPVPHFPHPQWDRLCFVQLWMYKMQSGGPIRPAPFGAPSHLNAQTAPRMLATDSKEDFAHRVEANAAAQKNKTCSACGKPEYALSAKEKFLCCSRCKAAGRMVWYCGVVQ
ncbi:hypothetical protein JCM10213v2_001617 [Rhodosporidiobolus nylandii]